MSLIEIIPATTSTMLHELQPLLTPLAGDGILDMLEKSNVKVQSLVRAVAITIALIFTIYIAVQSRLSMAKIIVAGLAGGLLIWLVFNVTAVKDKIGNDLDSASSVGIHQTVDPTHAAVIVTTTAVVTITTPAGV